MRWILILMVLTGCGGSSSSNDDGGGTTPPPVSAPSGDFETDCEDRQEGETSQKWSLSIGDSSYTEYSQSYWELGCSQAMSLSEEIGFDATFDDKGGGRVEMDLTVRYNRWTPKIAGFVSSLNENEICGVSTWKLNEPTSVAGRNCGNFTFPAVGDELKGLYIEDGDSITVSYGTTLPTSTDEDLVYKKK